MRSRQLLATSLRGYAKRFAMTAGFGTGDKLDPFTFDVRAMSAVDAGIANGQVGKSESIIEGRTRNAAIWRSKLVNLGLTSLRLPPPDNNVFTKFWLAFEGETAAREQQLLKSSLWRCGVEIESLYVPLHLRPSFAHFRRVRLPITERLWQFIFSVPVRPNLEAADWSRIDAALDFVRESLSKRIN
jgi:dTDP-4-amino-4,6-dideoxygalactose transaminase